MGRTVANTTNSTTTSTSRARAVRARTTGKGKATTSISSGQETNATAPDAGPLDRQSVPADLPSGGDEATSPTPAPAPAPVPAPQLPTSKLGRIRALLASPAGASLAQLREATGWQSHSVRAALTGLRKAGGMIEKTKDDGGITVYRITADAEQAR